MQRFITACALGSMLLTTAVGCKKSSSGPKVTLLPISLVTTSVAGALNTPTPGLIQVDFSVNGTTSESCVGASIDIGTGASALGASLIGNCYTTAQANSLYLQPVFDPSFAKPGGNGTTAVWENCTTHEVSTNLTALFGWLQPQSIGLPLYFSCTTGQAVSINTACYAFGSQVANAATTITCP